MAANIPWGKYDRSDWRRVPGASRRYSLVQNPSITISRRQYDEHYGTARAFGTYEKKAKHKSNEREALLRPARGRTSARKLSQAEQEVEINKRKAQKQDTAMQRRIISERNKAHKYPTKINLRNFKKGKISRTIELPVSYEAVETVRKAAADSGLVFGYYVGANMVDTRSNKKISFAAFGLRDISMKFKERDFTRLMEKCKEKSYAELVSLWIHIKLKSAIAEKRNYWKGNKNVPKG